MRLDLSNRNRDPGGVADIARGSSLRHREPPEIHGTMQKRRRQNQHQNQHPSHHRNRHPNQHPNQHQGRLLPTPIAVLVLGLILAGAPAALASDADQATSAVDTGIENLLEHRLERKGLDAVEVDVDDRQARLSGTVETLHQKKQAMRIARKLEDVRSVVATIDLEATDRVEADIVAEVSESLGTYRFYDVFDWLEARVDGDTVTLDGVVYQAWKKDAVAERIENIRGVRSVDNQIEILASSAFDDQIRYQVARAIYGDLTFFDRGSWINPPIHIIVERGRVRLEGIVRNEAERRLARNLASSAALSFGQIENNLLTSADLES
ncbi:MAG: BON domain-containing protein [Acidobacteria bacterium]|nr:MAG: BON domain-containing protein [Acidobacteriota bacterium]